MESRRDSHKIIKRMKKYQLSNKNNNNYYNETNNIDLN